MRVCFPLAAIVVLTIGTSMSAQSLPDEAGPAVGPRDSTAQQESITNPGGFGKSRSIKAIDPNRTDSTGKLDCRQQKDVRTEKRGPVRKDMDCVR